MTDHDLEWLSSQLTRRKERSCCVRGEGVQGVLTLFGRGAAQVCHDDREVELKEQLEVEEEDGDRQEEEVEVEKWRSRIKESAPWMSMQMEVYMRSELEPKNVKCETITTVEQMRSVCRFSASTPRNCRSQRRHWCSALWSACWCTRCSNWRCSNCCL